MCYYRVVCQFSTTYLAMRNNDNIIRAFNIMGLEPNNEKPFPIGQLRFGVSVMPPAGMGKEPGGFGKASGKTYFPRQNVFLLSKHWWACKHIMPATMITSTLVFSDL